MRPANGWPPPGLPYVIENVPGRRHARLGRSSCAAPQFGSDDLRRHRCFEIIVSWQPPHRRHEHAIASGRTFGTPADCQRERSRRRSHLPRRLGQDEWRDAMGIDWMTRDELAQAIPPAYTEWIGAQLLADDETVPDRRFGDMTDELLICARCGRHFHGQTADDETRPVPRPRLVPTLRPLGHGPHDRDGCKLKPWLTQHRSSTPSHPTSLPPSAGGASRSSAPTSTRHPLPSPCGGGTAVSRVLPIPLPG